jgi:hypothetical protein
MLEAATEAKIIRDMYHLGQNGNGGIINHTKIFNNSVFHNILNTLYNDGQHRAQDLNNIPTYIKHKFYWRERSSALVTRSAGRESRA